MATFLKDPPKFCTNIGAWEYTLAKLALLDAEKPKDKPRLDEGGNPTNYGQAVAIYKAVVKKYPAFQKTTYGQDALPEFRLRENETYERSQNVADLCEIFPVGEMFWYDDVLCEAVEYHGGEAIYPGPDGKLFVRGRICSVDPEGQHRGWPIGKTNGFPPHRCVDFAEALADTYQKRTITLICQRNIGYENMAAIMLDFARGRSKSLLGHTRPGWRAPQGDHRLRPRSQRAEQGPSQHRDGRGRVGGGEG